MFRLQYRVDSSTQLTVNAEYEGFQDPTVMVQNTHRMRSGAWFRYKWGEYGRILAPVRYVDSSFRSVVTSWWSSRAELTWMTESGTDVTSVKLVNITAPIVQRIRPYHNQWRGVLQLETY
jgi:hypothetical protein